MELRPPVSVESIGTKRPVSEGAMEKIMDETETISVRSWELGDMTFARSVYACWKNG